MIEIGELILRLGTYPIDFRVYAYEGEDVGLGIVDREGRYVGFIPCRPDKLTKP